MVTRLLAPAIFASLLALSGAASAGGPPPSIDDLDGATFVIRARVTEHDLLGSEESRYVVEITTTLTKTSPTTVAMTSVLGGMAFSAHYVNGFLMQAVDFEPGSPPTSATWMFAEVSGRPGKLKLQGVLNAYDVPPDFQVLRLTRVTGKQIAP